MTKLVYNLKVKLLVLFIFDDSIIFMVKRKKTIIYVLMIFILALRIGYSSYTFNFKYNEWKNEKRIITVISIDKVEESSTTYVGIMGLDKVCFSVQDVDNKYSFGDKITVICSNYKISTLGNPYEFNYKRYLNSKGVVLRLNISKILSVQKSNNIIVNIRKRISDTLDYTLGKYSNLAKSLMYGDDVYLDETFKEKCRNIGIGHMMCVSGTHVMFLTLAFENITNTKKKSKYFLVINFVLICYFYIVSLFKLSLFRVLILSLLNMVLFKKNYFLKVFLCIYIMLVINPFYIFNAGVIFSFLSVISIRVFNPVISSYVKVKLKITNEYIVSNLSLSISSLILILPFQIYYFGIICPISILSNIVISSVLAILMRYIFYSFILIFVPFISQILLKLVFLLLNIFVVEVNIIDKINIFNISVPRINIWVIILYYFSLIIIMNKSRIAIVYLWKYRKVAKAIMDVIIVFFLLYTCLWYVHTMYFESYIVYFNVGQGNMCLIHKGATNIVVDCGSTRDKTASYILSSFLKAKNIQNIDLVLITHMHKDHMNGLEEIIEGGINVERVGYSLPCEKVEEYLRLKSYLKKKNVGIISIEQLDNIQLNDISIISFSPPKDSFLLDKDMLNANSTVYLVKEGGKNMLFMGDSTKITEKYLLDNFLVELNNIDIYQVSHHGSKTSSLEEFVFSINISNAVISSQKVIYGHPDSEVIDLFKKLKIKTYITEEKGAIIF